MSQSDRFFKSNRKYRKVPEKTGFFYLVYILLFSNQLPPEYQRTSFKKITNYELPITKRGTMIQTQKAIQDYYIINQYKNNMGRWVCNGNGLERIEKMV